MNDGDNTDFSPKAKFRKEEKKTPEMCRPLHHICRHRLPSVEPMKHPLRLPLQKDTRFLLERCWFLEMEADLEVYGAVYGMGAP